MKKATAPFHIDRQEYHLTLDAVPASGLPTMR